MQVSTSNDVKIYNLSAGKSIPQWLNEKKRRNLERKDVDIRRRIQLIQDFEMPGISSSIALTADQQYIFAAGTYRPILKCYDVNDLSMKFDRGLDADVIKILPLSEDYSKVVLLQKDRYLEFHSRVGRYFRMRIPKFGRDFSFCREASDLFVVGDGSEIYRLNMEEGKFLTPLQTDADELNCCEFNDQHQLFVCGTTNGTVEAWDHRDAQRVGILNCDLDQFKDDAIVMDGNPSVTSLKFKDALNLGVGTSTGHILLYDIRSTRPRLIKNHNMGLPIQTLDFVQESDLVLSMDSRVLKIWKEQNGDPFAAIEPGSKLTQFVRYPNSGLLFFANDAPKMLQYFVPSLGPAPKWCYYLDSITEELEETEQPTVYDDYKFVTAPQLEEIGLERLIGSEYLRAYMHGYFIDIRLYNKAKTLTQPFAYENYKARKLREKVEEERETRLLLNKVKLPKVNKELASKLHADLNPERGGKLTTKKKQLASSLLEDTRFKNLFTNPDFEVDKESEQFQQITSRLQKHNEQHDNGRDYSEDEEIVGALDLNDANESRHESKDQDSTMNIDSEDYEDESDEVDETDRFGANPDASSDEEMEEEDEQSDEAEAEKPTKPKRPQRFKLVGVNTMRDFQSFAPSNDQIDPAMNLTGTMGERRKKLKELMAGQKVEDTPFGGKSMTFIMPNKKQEESITPLSVAVVDGQYYLIDQNRLLGQPTGNTPTGSTYQHAQVGTASRGSSAYLEKPIANAGSVYMNNQEPVNVGQSTVILEGPTTGMGSATPSPIASGNKFVPSPAGNHGRSSAYLGTPGSGSGSIYMTKAGAMGSENKFVPSSRVQGFNAGGATSPVLDEHKTSPIVPFSVAFVPGAQSGYIIDQNRRHGAVTDQQTSQRISQTETDEHQNGQQPPPTTNLSTIGVATARPQNSTSNFLVHKTQQRTPTLGLVTPTLLHATPTQEPSAIMPTSPVQRITVADVTNVIGTATARNPTALVGAKEDDGNVIAEMGYIVVRLPYNKAQTTDLKITNRSK